MNVTRPRYSVLNLFDPLASTPSRDAPSPDSDKENSSPPANDCAITAAFFGRTYKQSHPAPVLPKRRLVDIGDITIDEELEDNSQCNDDENETLTLPHPAATPTQTLSRPTNPSTSSPRTPLGELSLDTDATPLARTRTYRRPVLSPSSLSVPELPSSSSHEQTSITSVINAINLSGASFAEPGPTASFKESSTENRDEITLNSTPNVPETPQIVVSSADILVDSLSTFTLDTPTETPLVDTAPPVPPSPPSQSSSSQNLGLRPNSSSISSYSRNRHSIDLYSSFQLQLESEDASFDLLNDKISFLGSGSGMDSFMNAMEGDDSFDMSIEEVNMERALQKIKLEDETSEKKEGYQCPPTAATLSSEIQEKPATELLPNPARESSSSEVSPRRPLSLGSNFGFKSKLTPPVSPASTIGSTKAFEKNSTPSASRPISAPISPVFVTPVNETTPAPSSTPSTPPSLTREVPIYPPVVPALRIVKRANHFGHEKSSSSGNTSAAQPLPAPENPPVPTSIALRVPKPIPSGSSSRHATTSTAPVIGKIVVPGSSRVVSTQASTSLAAKNSSSGPRRVPIIENQSGSGNFNAKAASNSITGPRRVPVVTSTVTTTTAGEPTANKIPTISGLRAPSKYSTGIKSVSALPKPTSRLPAPVTSVGKTRVVSSVNGNGSRAMAGPGKDVPARRVMYGGQ